MEDKIGVNIVIREEKMGDKIVFVVNNEDTGIADFGNTLEEATENFKKSLQLYLDAYPEKKNLFFNKDETKSPLMVSRILI